MDQDLSRLNRVRIVLVGTQHPGNIGSAARAIKTMGLARLVLVAPERFPDPDAVMMAAGADDVLAASERFETLAEAVGDCRLVIGCTARSRRIALDELSPRLAAAKVLAVAGDGAEVALVFGRERTGLNNDELQLCHAAAHIPANPEYSSLNLAAAVQVLSYELRIAALAGDGAGEAGRAHTGRGTGSADAGRDGGEGHAGEGHAGEGAGDAHMDPRDTPATHAQLEGFFGQLDETLHAIDFHKGRAPESAMRKLRRIFLRGELDVREVRLLRGVLADAQRMARLAGDRGKS
jgi:tRNA (cytidine32/uridine32-2'-O)-methyltransferase